MENQRVRLSKQMLKGALIDLLEEKSIKKVTVYEICARAQINRTTFYKYYGSPYDLLEDIEKDVFGEIDRRLRSQNFHDADSLTSTIAYFEENLRTCRLLVNSIKDTEFAEKLFAHPILMSLMEYFTPKDCDPRQMEYIRTFMWEGGYAMIRKWINSDERETPEEMSALILRLESRVLGRSDIK